MSLLWEPFQYPFMRTGFLAAVTAGALCGLLGVYVVLRRVSYIGHALTHSALPGLVWAHRAGASLFGGALAANLVTALGIGWMSRRKDVHEDTAIGVFSTVMFAVGLVMMAGTRAYGDLSALLFGQVLGVSASDARWMLAAAAFVAGALLLFHKEWMLATLDPGHAQLVGLPVGLLRLGFLGLLVLGVGAAVQAVGAVLTGALLVAPAAAARLLARRLPGMMLLSAALGAFSGGAGLLVSYYAEVPSGAAIVLTGGAVYGAAHAATGAREWWAAAPPLRRALAVALALNTLVIAVEALGGWRAKSLTLGLDVVHNLSDEAALVLLFAAHGARAPSARLRRAADLLNAGGLLTIFVLLVAAAADRLRHPAPVDGFLTMVCGALAVAGNAGVAWVLKGPGRKDPSLNLAHVHNTADALLSLVPVTAGALVFFTGRPGLDPLLALAATLVMTVPALRALRAAWRGTTCPHA